MYRPKDRDNVGITVGIDVTLENEKFTWGNYCPIFCLLLDRVHLILIIRLGHCVIVAQKSIIFRCFWSPYSVLGLLHCA